MSWELSKTENTVIHNNVVYTLKVSTGIINIYMDETERNIFIRDIYGNGDVEINAVTICNSGFLKIVY